jgi:expansin (peptidoglycan-binding protein)
MSIMLRGALSSIVLLGLLACSGEGSPAPTSTADGGFGNGGGGGGGGSGDGGTVTPGGPLSAVIDGVATYYDATGAGACSFDPSPNDLDVAAMNAPQFEGSSVCGECVDVTGPNGKVTVRIVDLCPECQTGHLDLSRQAFAKIAALSAGRVPIKWQVVPCNVTGPISYRYKEGSSKYWTAIQVRNHRLPIKSLEYEKNGAFVAIPRQSYNYFVVQSGVGDQPNGLKLRTTAIDGKQLVDLLPTLQEATTIPGASQF